MPSTEQVAKPKGKSGHKKRSAKKKTEKQGPVAKRSKAARSTVKLADESPASKQTTAESVDRPAKKSPGQKKKKKKKSRLPTPEGTGEKPKKKKKRSRQHSAEVSQNNTTDGKSPPPQTNISKEEEKKKVPTACLVFKPVPPVISPFYSRFAQEESWFDDEKHWGREADFMGMRPLELLKSGPGSGLTALNLRKPKDMKIVMPGHEERRFSDVIVEMHEVYVETQKKKDPGLMKKTNNRVDKAVSAEKPKKSKGKKTKKVSADSLVTPKTTSADPSKQTENENSE